jgi:hypothetical protein
MQHERIRRWKSIFALLMLSSIGLCATNFGDWTVPVSVGTTINSSGAEQ